MKLLLYGSQTYSDTLAELAQDCGHDVVGKIDDAGPGPGILGTLSEISNTHPAGKYGIVLAIGYSNLTARWKAWQRVRNLGYKCPILVHPRAYIANSAKLSCGSVVMAGALVDARSTVGEASVLWPASCINHDVALGSNCFISPQATICGFAAIGNNSIIGAGAVVVDHSVLPAGTFVKALSLFKGRLQT